MSFNGSGTFQINSAGQPVVANTVISATVFNALTADLATGLTTCLTKDGQTTPTANIPLGTYKITGLGAGTAATDAARLDQVQSTAAKLITPTGTDTITGTMSPALTAYAAGQLFYFIANGANTGAVTINIDGLGAKSITRDGATALIAGDISAGEIVVICYDGTRFQMINAANSFGNTTINGTLTVTGNTGLQANVSITSALSVGGVFAVTGAATLGSTLSVTGKADLPTVSTASMNAAVAVVTTGTVTNLTSTSASIASMNAGVALLTTATVTTLTATGASIASANLGNAVISSMTLTGASVASANVGTATITGNLTLSAGTANGVLYLNGSKVATSGSALVFDGTNLGIGTTSPDVRLQVTHDNAETSQFNLGASILHLTNTNTTNNNWAQIFFTDSDGGAAAATFGVQYTDHANDYGNLSFATRGSSGLAERARITAAGELLVGVNTATANGGVIQVSNGITFPATQSAASNANTLDDYEEGNWTPTALGSTTAGTTTYVSQAGSYTKIGRQVTANLFVNYSAMTGTGNLRIGGLPFTKNTDGAAVICPVMTGNLNWSGGTSIVGFMGDGYSYVLLYGIADDGAYTVQGCVNEAAEIYLTVTYFV